MVKTKIHSYTLRTDYDSYNVGLEDFKALTTNWQALLHTLVVISNNIYYYNEKGEKSTLTSLLRDNVLTVLADIHRKKLDGYSMSFTSSRGTIRQGQYVRKLKNDITNWENRLKAFLRNSVSSNYNECSSVVVARELCDILSDSRKQSEKDEYQYYYGMLHTVCDIQKRIGEYTQKIENCGDTDPSVSLLMSFVRNYCSVAQKFNKSFAKLPDLYRNDILHVTPRQTSKDYAFILVTPKEKIPDFTLPKYTSFSADDNQVYKTLKKETITHVQCTDTRTLSIDTLDRSKCKVGWQIESSLFVLSEGTRTIDIYLDLSSDVSVPDNDIKQDITLQYSSADGWNTVKAKCDIIDKKLHFSFVLERNMTAPVSCVTDIHETNTVYPVIRILFSPYTKAYSWAEKVYFTDVTIEVAVSGMTNFTFYNDLGEVDTTQPFAIFGLQAAKGAWFIFGNEELRLKCLKEVTLDGTWQKIPETRTAFDERYKDYGVDSDGFRVTTEFRVNERWEKMKSQQLFFFDENGKLAPANIHFSFDTPISQGGELDFIKDGFFRVSLLSPEIGFGAEKYRSLFVQVMMKNSKCKKNEVQEPPMEPCVPYLSDVELSYKAKASLCLSDCTSFTDVGSTKTDKINLSRIMEFSTKETFSYNDDKQQPLVLPFPINDMQYFAFTQLLGKSLISMYVDMKLPVSKIPFEIARPGQKVTLDWDIWDGRIWKRLPAESITTEETKGFTQSGYIVISLGESVKSNWLDCDNQIWIRASKNGEVSACLDLRNVWTNLIKVTSDNCKVEPLPAGTIKSTVDQDERIADIVQPYPSFGGNSIENKDQCVARLTAHMRHRNRAVTRKDYELLVLELFPEIEMAQCFTIPKKNNNALPLVCIVVFSRQEDSEYYLSSAWKLSEMEQTLKQYTPASVQLQVTNPQYEKVIVKCRAALHNHVEDKGKVLANLTTIIENYFVLWQIRDEFPMPGQTYSFKELYSRIVNHEDLQNIESLEVNGRQYNENSDIGEEDDIIGGQEAWSVLLPEIEIELIEPNGPAE